MDKLPGMMQQRLDISVLPQKQNPLLSRYESKETGGFAESLKTAMQDTDKLQRVADKKLELLASGEEVDIHGTMIALQEADLSIRTIGAFKDKVTEAYKALINMAI